MESHDEERQMFKCIAYGNIGAGYSIKDTTIALQRAALTSTFFFTIPGPKMIWQFGEQGYDYSINWPSGTEASRLDNKPPRWDYMSQSRRLKLYNTYAALTRLRTDNPLFQTTNFTLDVGGALKKIKWQKDGKYAVVLGNFGITDANIVPAFYATGTWYDYLTGDSIAVTDVNSPIKLKPGEARLYLSEKVDNPFSLDELAGSLLNVAVAPNPVIDQCRVIINYPGKERYTVQYFNLSGKQTGETITGWLENTRELTWKPENSGIYFVRVRVGTHTITKKITVL